MTWLANVAWRFGLVIALITPGFGGAHAAIPLLPICTWPIESTGQGILNVATQDTNTTYWFMPIGRGFACGTFCRPRRKCASAPALSVRDCG